MLEQVVFGRITSAGRWFIALAMLLLVSAQVPAKSLLTDLDGGEPRELSDYVGQGKWLVVMFWAHNCHVCNEEAPDYQAFYDRHREHDATVVGISIDGESLKKEAKEFVGRHKLTFPNLIGEPEAVTGMFTDLTGAPWMGTPTFLIYTPSGKLVVQQPGGVPVSLIEEFIKEQTAAGSI